MAKTERKVAAPSPRPVASGNPQKVQPQPSSTIRADRSKAAAKTSGDSVVPEDRSQLPLTGLNFIMMALCGIMIIAGFVLMLGGSSTFDSFNEDIFSVRRVVVGPAFSFIGFVLMAFAILYRRRGNNINNIKE